MFVFLILLGIDHLVLFVCLFYRRFCRCSHLYDVWKSAVTLDENFGKKSNECCLRHLSQIDSTKVLLLFPVISPFTRCFSKKTDWKLQALESTKLIGLRAKSNRFFGCFCAQHLLVVTDSGKSQHRIRLNYRGEKKGRKRRKGVQPEHNLETMWHIFHFLHALEPVLSPNWQTHSRRPFNISQKNMCLFPR